MLLFEQGLHTRQGVNKWLAEHERQSLGYNVMDAVVAGVQNAMCKSIKGKTFLMENNIPWNADAIEINRI